MKKTERITGLLSAITCVIMISTSTTAAEPFRLIVTHLEPPLVPKLGNGPRR